MLLGKWWAFLVSNGLPYIVTVCYWGVLCDKCVVNKIKGSVYSSQRVNMMMMKNYVIVMVILEYKYLTNTLHYKPGMWILKAQAFTKQGGWEKWEKHSHCSASLLLCIMGSVGSRVFIYFLVWVKIHLLFNFCSFWVFFQNLSHRNLRSIKIYI